MVAGPVVRTRANTRSDPVVTHSGTIARKAVSAAAVPSGRVSTLLPSAVPQLQSATKVSSPGDPAEREAEAVSKRVMRMPAPVHGTVARGVAAAGSMLPSRRAISRAAEPPSIARKADGPSQVPAAVTSEISAVSGSGAPLPRSAQGFMQPRFGADFSRVRVHTGDSAAKLSRKLNAHAFTVGHQIFFGKDKFQPETHEGKELLAHELTHTIQQGGAIQRSADQAAVTQRSEPQVQRAGSGGVLNYFADKANIIPGFRMFTIVLGVNPINMSAVDRSAANILRALIEFLPGGGLITQALENSGVFEKVGNWVAQQIQTLGMVGSAIKQAVMTFIDSLSLSDVFDLGGVWERAKRIFTEPIDRIISFAKGLVTDIIKFIKDAILIPLAKLAEGTSGYPLLKAVLGKDPITGEAVPDDASALLGALMTLAGQEEIWGNIRKANAIGRISTWFKGAKAGLIAFVQQIPTLAINAFKSLELADIVLVPRALIKVAGVFGGFLGQFIGWVGTAVWNLLEIVFDVVSPGAFAYVKKTGAALKSILKNPLPFVGNLVKAAKLGFTNFGAHFLTHLKAGLLDWLTGSLPGVYIPQALTLPEFGKLALSVFGLGWAQIRAKIVKALGSNGEKIMQGLETAFDVIKALVTGGPAAAWNVIKEKLTNLKDMIVDGIIDFIKDAVVTKAIPKLIAMFIPGAGFISAIISIYDTVKVFIAKISKIIQVVTAFINSIVAIAAGNIGAAASKVESILAGLLALAINFLAGFAGLGKAADKIMEVINKLRDRVDKALDVAINWIVGRAKALFAKLFGKDKGDERSTEQKQADLNLAIAEVQALQAAPGATEQSVRKGLASIKSRYRMQSLDIVVDADSENEEKLHVVGKINPEKSTPSARIQKDGTVGPLGIVRKMLSWAADTLKALLKDPIWNKFKAKLRGRYESAGLAIRHKVSISDTIKNTDAALAPKKPDVAAEMLAAKGYPVEGKPKTKPKIVSSARDFLQAANNDVNNLFVGDAYINSTVVKERYDAGDTGVASAADQVAHREDFVEAWGFKDEEFVITMERKSKRLGTSLVTETRKSTGSKDLPAKP